MWWLGEWSGVAQCTVDSQSKSTINYLQGFFNKILGALPSGNIPLMSELSIQHRLTEKILMEIFLVNNLNKDSLDERTPDRGALVVDAPDKDTPEVKVPKINILLMMELFMEVLLMK